MKRSLGFGLVLGLGVVVACSSSSDDTPVPNPNADASVDPPEVTFPKGFLWGSATAGFQVEKGLPNSDWGLWVKTPGKIKGGDDPDKAGPDALAHIDEDVALLTKTGQNLYRFSIEWSRLYPTRDAFEKDAPDVGAIAAYDKLFATLKAAGIVPMVTLQHFSLPSWLSDPAKAATEPQGWERPEMVDAFATWCSRAAKRWGGTVDWWATINEPMVTPIAGYIQGSFPPGLVLAFDRGLVAGKNMARGHAKCFDAIKAADVEDADADGKTSLVGIVQHMRAIEPEEPSDPEDVAAADRVRYLNNLWFLEATTRGDWDDDFDGKLDGPNDKKADPALANKNDWIGVNYYTTVTASASRGFKLPVVNAAIRQDHIPNDRPKTDFAWDIYPKGFRVVLDEAKRYGLPLFVTENGIADARDVNRGRFLLEHLYELGKAMADGTKVLGYVHWALIDNFEWASGFCPRFGLASYDPASGARTLRPSADVLTRIAKGGKVTKAEVDAAPPYVAPAPCE